MYKVRTLPDLLREFKDSGRNFYKKVASKI
ncbi:hypothetical protein [Salmonella phage SD-1_S14]|nr:hypothetical protein [Salmonella phage SD-2_S15]WPK18891.1 hypothetical protein [Salmonella phage SD-6_S16]WPK19558.1 hypothetical protein [Salmonella phage SD-1_S14]WPK20586.1 hypothetical protein [Salmonella phage SD-15_S21]